MGYLTFFVHIVVGSTLAGSLVIVALTAGYYEGRAIIAAAVVGYVVSIPLSWFIARAIKRSTVGVGSGKSDQAPT